MSSHAGDREELTPPVVTDTHEALRANVSSPPLTSSGVGDAGYSPSAASPMLLPGAAVEVQNPVISLEDQATPTAPQPHPPAADVGDHATFDRTSASGGKQPRWPQGPASEGDSSPPPPPPPHSHAKKRRGSASTGVITHVLRAWFGSVIGSDAAAPAEGYAQVRAVLAEEASASAKARRLIAAAHEAACVHGGAPAGCGLAEFSAGALEALVMMLLEAEASIGRSSPMEQQQQQQWGSEKGSRRSGGGKSEVAVARRELGRHKSAVLLAQRAAGGSKGSQGSSGGDDGAGTGLSQQPANKLLGGLALWRARMRRGSRSFRDGGPSSPLSKPGRRDSKARTPPAAPAQAEETPASLTSYKNTPLQLQPEDESGVVPMLGPTGGDIKRFGALANAPGVAFARRPQDDDELGSDEARPPSPPGRSMIAAAAAGMPSQSSEAEGVPEDMRLASMMLAMNSASGSAAGDALGSADFDRDDASGSMSDGAVDIGRETRHAELDEDIDDGMAELNQYVLLDTLGHGTQGEVYLAMDTMKNELRAVKAVPRPAQVAAGRPMNAAKRARWEALLREVGIMKRCRHRHVVSLYEVIDDPAKDTMYLVLQYVEHGALGAMTPDGTASRTYPAAQLATYGRQICAGLEYLHRHGVIHRDIKPENILVGQNEQVYLADFGMSEAFEGKGAEHRVTGTRGTAAFLAPELLAEVLEDEQKAQAEGAAAATAESLPDAPLLPPSAVAAADSSSSPALSPAARPAADLSLGNSTASGGERPTVTIVDSAEDERRRSSGTLRQQLVEGEAVDVWALGITFYVLLYGQLPWEFETASELFAAIQANPIELRPIPDFAFSASESLPTPSVALPATESLRMLPAVESIIMPQRLACSNLSTPAAKVDSGDLPRESRAGSVFVESFIESDDEFSQSLTLGGQALSRHAPRSGQHGSVSPSARHASVSPSTRLRAAPTGPASGASPWAGSVDELWRRLLIGMLQREPARRLNVKEVHRYLVMIAKKVRQHDPYKTSLTPQFAVDKMSDAVITAKRSY